MRFWIANGVGLGLLALGCSPDPVAMWTPVEMSQRVEEFVHFAEAYAVVDLCMPAIDADQDAKHGLLSKIGVRSYSSLQGIDTEVELGRFLAYHRSLGGSQEQHAQLEQAYRSAYGEAQPHLRSLDTCLETVSDYANTILNTKLTSD